MNSNQKEVRIHEGNSPLNHILVLVAYNTVLGQYSSKEYGDNNMTSKAPKRILSTFRPFAYRLLLPDAPDCKWGWK